MRRRSTETVNQAHCVTPRVQCTQITEHSERDLFIMGAGCEEGEQEVHLSTKALKTEVRIIKAYLGNK